MNRITLICAISILNIYGPNSNQLEEQKHASPAAVSSATIQQVASPAAVSSATQISIAEKMAKHVASIPPMSKTMKKFGDLGNQASKVLMDYMGLDDLTNPAAMEKNNGYTLIPLLIADPELVSRLSEKHAKHLLTNYVLPLPIAARCVERLAVLAEEKFDPATDNKRNLIISLQVKPELSQLLQSTVGLLVNNKSKFILSLQVKPELRQLLQTTVGLLIHATEADDGINFTTREMHTRISTPKVLEIMDAEELSESLLIKNTKYVHHQQANSIVQPKWLYRTVKWIDEYNPNTREYQKVAVAPPSDTKVALHTQALQQSHTKLKYITVNRCESNIAGGSLEAGLIVRIQTLAYVGNNFSRSPECGFAQGTPIREIYIDTIESMGDYFCCQAGHSSGLIMHLPNLTEAPNRFAMNSRHIIDFSYYPKLRKVGQSFGSGTPTTGHFAPKLDSAGTHLMSNTRITSVDTTGINTLGENAFDNCPLLTQYNIRPEHVKQISWPIVADGNAANHITQINLPTTRPCQVTIVPVAPAKQTPEEETPEEETPEEETPEGLF